MNRAVRFLQNDLRHIACSGQDEIWMVNLAKSAGCRPITLGPIILRTETAAIYCLSVLSHELFGSV